MQEDEVSMAAAVSTRDDGISRVLTEAAVALRAGRRRRAMAAAVTLKGEGDVEGGRRLLSFLVTEAAHFSPAGPIVGPVSGELIFFFPWCTC
jgi:hypothetical protein